MPYSVFGKNLMLDALRASISHAALLQAGTPQTGLTSVASTDLLTKAGHGFSAGDLVVLSALTGGAGFVVGDPLFVIASGLTANDFRVSTLSGGTTFDHTSNLTAGTVTKLTEVTGGSPAYARKAIAYAAAAEGLIDDTTNGAVFDVPACTVSYAAFYTALTAGNLHGIVAVTPEVFAAQGTYTLTDAKLDLNKP